MNNSMKKPMRKSIRKPMKKSIYSFEANYSWPCEYCKQKFIDVCSVINHEIYFCEKNPKLKLKSSRIEENSKENHSKSS